MREFTMILTEQADRVITNTPNQPNDLNPLSWQVINETDSVLDLARMGVRVRTRSSCSVRIIVNSLMWRTSLA